MERNEVNGAGFSERLATRWSEFVDCEKRLAAEAPFLRRLLAKLEEPSVIDVCMGTACEVLFLAGQGVAVVGNEISGHFRTAAVKEASRRAIRMEATAYDWKSLEKGLGGRQFDILLCLGNSFSMLLDQGDRRMVAGVFSRICKPSGYIVIDERNYRYILAESDEIVKGCFRYGRRVVYCGSDVYGRPVEISDQLVRFRYFDTQTGEALGDLKAYPFKEGELVELFRDVGCTLELSTSDLEPGFNADADFYTYVFRPTAVLQSRSRAR